MPQFTVTTDTGTYQVNASNAQAALGNAPGGNAQIGNSNSSSSSGGGGGQQFNAPNQGTSGSGGGAAQYNTVNGLQTIASMAQQLLNAGWGGNTSDPSAVTSAYASTTGGAVNPSGTNVNTNTGNNNNTGQQQPQQTDPWAGLNAYAAQTSGVTDKQLAQQKAEFDAQLQFARDQMTQLGIPQLQINQMLAYLQQLQFQSQLNQVNAAETGWYQPMTYTPGTGSGTGAEAAGTLTPSGSPQQTLAAILQNAQLSGMYNGAPTEAAREFNATNALQQGQLGQQYLATAAQLQGPQNTFQLSNYLRGAQGNQAVPTYLQSLASNMGMPAFTSTGTTAPTTQSAAGLASQLGGTSSATPGWDYQSTLNTIQNIMSRGAGSLAPGTLEQLTPDELQAFGSGLGQVGGDLPSFMAQYNASRVGQNAPVAAGTLA